jgi:hypothetical protein
MQLFNYEDGTLNQTEGNQHLSSQSFSRLSASADNCAIFEVICLFIPLKDISFSNILHFVIVCLALPSLDFKMIKGHITELRNKHKVVTLSYLM